MGNFLDFFYYLLYNNVPRKGEIYMLNDEICKLRDKLNKSIEQGEDYAITYKLSIELDELITKYYKDRKKQNFIVLE